MWQELIINCGPSFHFSEVIISNISLSFRTCSCNKIAIKVWIWGLGSATTNLCLEWGTGLGNPIITRVMSNKMQQWNILQLVRGGIYILHESNFHSPTSHMLLHSSRLTVHGGRGTHLPEGETHATDWDHPYYSKHNQTPVPYWSILLSWFSHVCYSVCFLVNCSETWPYNFDKLTSTSWISSN